MAVCALVASCDFNEWDFRKRWKRGEYAFLLAVDAGFAHLESIGCVPDFTLGDFDSLGYVPDGANVERHPTHKDKSDLELALDFAAEHGFNAVVIYGALGGRLDHSLANLQVCARYAEMGLGVELIGLDSRVTILAGPAILEFSPLEHGIVSVFSAVAASRGVTERGLKYPLDRATLSNRTTLGLSNELIGQYASVSVEEGTLFVFHPLEA